jgi:hypothetical protein
LRLKFRQRRKKRLRRIKPTKSMFRGRQRGHRLAIVGTRPEYLLRQTHRLGRVTSAERRTSQV